MDSDKFQQFQRIEPRLAEYYLRKKFNKKNNIEDDTIERQYQITDFDIKTINDFIKTGAIASKNLESQLFCEFIEIPKEKQKFASEELLNDYRFQRLKKKYDADSKANIARENISNLSRNYGNFITDYNCPDNQQINQTKTNKSIKANQSTKINQNSRYQTYSNPYILNKETPTNVKEPWNSNKPSRIQLNQVVYDNQYNSYQEHSPSLDNILDKTKKYKQKVDATNDYIKPSDYEDLNRLNLSMMNNCKQDDTGMLNINVENYIKYGNPSSKAKSLGFENPVEHFFSYIDDSIQDPDHVCFDRPQLTRNMNRKSFRGCTND
jgi:hypothetical protein